MSSTIKHSYIMLLSFLISILIIISFTIYVLKLSKTEILQTKMPYEKHIGNKVLIGNDTLYIIDYSIIHNTFILNNNMSVDTFYVFKHLIK